VKRHARKLRKKTCLHQKVQALFSLIVFCVLLRKRCRAAAGRDFLFMNYTVFVLRVFPETLPHSREEFFMNYSVLFYAFLRKRCRTAAGGDL